MMLRQCAFLIALTLAACSAPPRLTPTLPTSAPSPTFMPLDPTATVPAEVIPTLTPFSPTAVPDQVTIMPSQTATSSVVIIPEIHSLSVTPDEGLTAGDQVLAEWDAEGAQVWLCYSTLNIYGADCQPVDSSGSMTLTVNEGTGIIRLRALGQDPAAEIALEYYVNVACANAWVWEVMQGDDRCPEPEKLWEGLAQPFERGWLIDTGDRVYALVDDGDSTAAEFTKPLEITGDTSSQYTAPDGLYAPEGDFGVVWRGDTASTHGTNYVESLGWALLPAVRYEAFEPCWSMKDVPDSVVRSCYLVHPAGGLIAIVRDGPLFYWEYES